MSRARALYNDKIKVVEAKEKRPLHTRKQSKVREFGNLNEIDLDVQGSRIRDRRGPWGSGPAYGFLRTRRMNDSPLLQIVQ